MSDAVAEILKRIQQLSEEDRLALEDCLARLADADWTHELDAPQLAETNGADDAAVANRRYPLRGSVVRYDLPTEPVAPEDWEAAR